MALEIYEWNSFSCNNSSDYRLVAKFDDPKTAAAMKKELDKFFAKHAEEIDELQEDDDFDYDDLFETISEAANKLGKKYGFTWKEGMTWGDGCLSDDEPGTWVVGDTLVVYHTYMGGFGELSKLLAKAGGSLLEKGDERGAPIVWVELDLPAKNGEAFGQELVDFFEQRHSVEWLHEWNTRIQETDYAWGEGNGSAKDVTFALEGEHVTFTYTIRPDYLENLQAYLKKNKARNLVIRVATKKDVSENRKRDQKLAKALTKTKAKSVAKATKSDAFDPSGKSYLFTGKLAAMTRAEAEARAKALGGTVAGSVTPTLDVLVVGDDGSPLYGDGAKGAKLTKAEALNAKGASIRVISETAFLGLKKK